MHKRIQADFVFFFSRPINIYYRVHFVWAAFRISSLIFCRVKSKKDTADLALHCTFLVMPLSEWWMDGKGLVNATIKRFAWMTKWIRRYFTICKWKRLNFDVLIQIEMHVFAIGCERINHSTLLFFTHSDKLWLFKVIEPGHNRLISLSLSISQIVRVIIFP